MKVELHNQVLIPLAIVVYGLAAFNLTGYYHPDEHYQIIEFAQLKLGNISEESLAWEYKYGMRPSLQPWIVYLIQRLTNISNPYILTLVLRCIAATLAIYSIIKVNKAFCHTIKTLPIAFLLSVSFFLWFLPYINVRFSSENLAGLMFLLAVSYVIGRNKKTSGDLFLCGVYLALSFLFRFQAAAMIAGLLLWLLIVSKTMMKDIIVIILGSTAIIIFGTILDYFFYGYWTCSFWVYFKVNIINDVASKFGTMDAFQYLTNLTQELITPFGVLILFSYIFLLIHNSKSFLIWCTLPFVILHLIIPHKEIRFLFPIANLIPMIIVSAADIILKNREDIWIKINSRWKVIGQFILVSLIPLNVILLAISLFSPPQNGKIAIAETLSKSAEKEKVSLYGLESNNPYKPYTFLNQSFYNQNNLSFTKIESYESLSKSKSNKNRLLIVQRKDLSNTYLQSYLNNSAYFEIATSRPMPLTNFLDFFGLVNDDYIIYSLR